MAVHPIGFAVIGVSMAGFGVLPLAVNPRSREAWARISAMGLAGLTVVAVPAVFILAAADGDAQPVCRLPERMRRKKRCMPRRGEIAQARRLIQPTTPGEGAFALDRAPSGGQLGAPASSRRHKRQGNGK
jgi:hypothetical protein